jgi:hypothetical protein
MSRQHVWVAFRSGFTGTSPNCARITLVHLDGTGSERVRTIRVLIRSVNAAAFIITNRGQVVRSDVIDSTIVNYRAPALTCF